MNASRRPLSPSGRYPFVPYLLALTLLLVVGVLDFLRFADNVDLASAITRHTARLAFLFFFITFTISVWRTWRRTELTAWLMRQRRHFGLSFALLHFIHLAALSTLFVLLEERPDVVTVVFGGLGYVLLAAMALTSNRYSRRLLGRGWRVLHLTGCWYLWLIFTRSYVSRLDSDAGAEPYWMFALLSVLAMSVPLLRAWAWTRRRAGRAQGGAVPA